MSEWVSEWVIVVERLFSNVSAISWREQVNFYSASSLKQQSAVEMSLHSDTVLWLRANQSLFLLLNAACLEEKQQIPIV
jgi:hypothetical protein